MRNVLMTLIVTLGVIALATPAAMAGSGNDGSHAYAFNWARDDDGDGIPNGLDPDWVAPKDGSGYKGPFIGPMLIGPGNGTGYAYRNGDNVMTRTREHAQKQHESGRTLGDIIREHLRTRDGSCAN